jgi:replication factor C small subunit
VVLTEKHRPRTLAEIVGQEAAESRLQAFVASPYSTAFVLSGYTGCGKTSAAKSLAHDLGVDLMWGFHEIKSTEGDIEEVGRALKSLRFCAPGSGEKLVLVDEADSMSSRAKAM